MNCNPRVLPIVVAVFGSIAIGACSVKGEGVCEIPVPATIGESGLEHRFLVQSIELPGSLTRARELALNIDGDLGGLTENQLGLILAVINQQSKYDLSVEVNELIDSRELLQVIDVRATSLSQADGVGVFVGLGIDLDGDATDNDSGKEPIALDGDVKLGRMSGFIEDGRIVVELGTAPLAITFPGLGELFVLHLEAARLEGIITEDGIEGRIAGGVRKEDIDAVILPALAEGFRRAIAKDCVSGSCVEGSFGALLIDLFDGNDPKDFAVSLDELRNSSLVTELLRPDLDLFTRDGQLAPRCDLEEEKDAVSISVGFRATRASYPSSRLF